MGELEQEVGQSYDQEGFRGKFTTRFLFSRSCMSEWREEAQKYARAYAGDPWEFEDRAALEQTDRPAVTFNYSMTTINSILGHELADRREIQFKGVGLDLFEQQIAEWMTSVHRTLFIRCDGHRQTSNTYLDQLVTGYGWAHVFMNESKFPFRLQVEQVDNWEMHPDPAAKDDNLTDMRWLVREREWSRDDLEAVWGDKGYSLFMGDKGYPSHNPKIAYEDYVVEGKLEPPGEDSARVYEYQYKVKEEWIAFSDPEDGNTREMRPDEFREYMELLRRNANQAMEIETVNFYRDVYYQAYLAGGPRGGTIVLQDPVRLECDCFTYVCCTGFRKKNARTKRTTFMGMMGLIYEPQMWSSKTLSTLVEMMSRGSKGGGFVEAGAFEDPEDFVKNSSKPGAWHIVSDGALSGQSQKIMERRAMNWPAGMERLVDLAIQGIRDISGVSEYSLGTSVQERSNVYVSNLQSKTQILLSVLTDPMAGFRVQLGRVMAEFIRLYIPARELDRMLPQEPVEGVTHISVPDEASGEMVVQSVTLTDGRPLTPGRLLKQVKESDYEVVVDTGSATTTEKQQLWQILTATGLLQDMLDKGLPVQGAIPTFFRLMPGVPAAIAEKLATDLEMKLEEQEKMGTMQGLMEVFQGLGPEQQGVALQQMQSMAQEAMASQRGMAAAAGM